MAKANKDVSFTESVVESSVQPPPIDETNTGGDAVVEEVPDDHAVVHADGPCCWLELCCPPDDAAVALGNHLEASIPMSNGDVPAPEETYTSIAGRLHAEFRLVPKELAPAPAYAHGSMANAAMHQLTALNEHVRRELLEILPGLGYEVEHENR